MYIYMITRCACVRTYVRTSVAARSVLRYVFSTDSANMLCIPLYSFVQGSYKFSSSPPSNTTPAARIGAAKFQGFRKWYLVIYSLYGLRSTPCIVSNPRVLAVTRTTPTQEGRAREIVKTYRSLAQSYTVVCITC